jgi:hypothetical protein
MLIFIRQKEKIEMYVYELMNIQKASEENIQKYRHIFKMSRYTNFIYKCIF